MGKENHLRDFSTFHKVFSVGQLGPMLTSELVSQTVFTPTDVINKSSCWSWLKATQELNKRDLRDKSVYMYFTKGTSGVFLRLVTPLGTQGCPLCSHLYQVKRKQFVELVCVWLSHGKWWKSCRKRTFKEKKKGSTWALLGENNLQSDSSALHCVETENWCG